MNRYIEIGGWIGVIAIIAGYALSTFQIIYPESVFFICLNLFGAVLIVIDAYKDKNYQPAVLNTVWAIIALIGLVRIIFVI